MNPFRRIALALLLPTVLLAAADGARGQIATQFPGLATIPDDDFTWVWGNFDRALQGFSPNLTMEGTDRDFACSMTVRLAVSHRLTDTERSQLERDVERSSSFIRGASDAINFLHQRRDVDWARLNCARDEEAEARQRDSIIDQRLQRRVRPIR
jgi:hypothetical protein